MVESPPPFYPVWESPEILLCEWFCMLHQISWLKLFQSLEFFAPTWWPRGFVQHVFLLQHVVTLWWPCGILVELWWIPQEKSAELISARVLSSALSDHFPLQHYIFSHRGLGLVTTPHRNHTETTKKPQRNHTETTSKSHKSTTCGSVVVLVWIWCEYLVCSVWCGDHVVSTWGRKIAV